MTDSVEAPTNGNPVLVRRTRAGYVERAHPGRFAIVDRTGAVVMAVGDVDEAFLPRSSCKILQAMPMMESGAGAHLTQQRLALSCASHQGSAAHASLAGAWLSEMGLGEADLECGPQPPADTDTRHALRDAGESPCQLHNNCSGKHTAMLRQAVSYRSVDGWLRQHRPPGSGRHRPGDSGYGGRRYTRPRNRRVFGAQLCDFSDRTGARHGEDRRGGDRA